MYMEIVLMVIFFVGVAIAIPTIKAAIIGAPFFWAPKKAIQEALLRADLKKGDIVYDLGFGSGRTLFIANSLEAKAIGFELSHLAFYFVKILILLRKKRNIEIIRRDFYQENLSAADVVYCFLTPKAMKRLKIKFEKELKKGAKIISYGFSIPNWDTQEIIKGYPGNIYIYKI